MLAYTIFVSVVQGLPIAALSGEKFLLLVCIQGSVAAEDDDYLLLYMECG
jgi:hypothetical protein